MDKILSQLLTTFIFTGSDMQEGVVYRGEGIQAGVGYREGIGYPGRGRVSRG